MKTMRLVSFTSSGAEVAARIEQALSEEGWSVRRSSGRGGDALYMGEPLMEWTRAAFQSDAIVFVGACGIAVRAVAPFITSKAADPAVVVVDDRGSFAISLLSGHIGGANALSRMIAQKIGAFPVITTATDGEGLFAADEWAKRQGLFICGYKEAKAVSAALLAGSDVGFQSEFPILGTLPYGIVPRESGALGIFITVGMKTPFEVTLRLVPGIVGLGIGCRRGTNAGTIGEAVENALLKHGVAREAVVRVSSIDIKRDEPGLKEFCENNRLPFTTFSAEELESAEGEFTASPFVKDITGVDNVCGRSAALSCGNGRLLFEKYTHSGVTVAAAVEDYTVHFGL